MNHLYQASRVGMTKRTSTVIASGTLTYVPPQSTILSGGMDPQLYAKTIVDEALCRSPRRWIWEGQFSWVMWFFDAFLGRGILDWFLSKRFGLTEFGGLLSGRSGKVKGA